MRASQQNPEITILALTARIREMEERLREAEPIVEKYEKKKQQQREAYRIWVAKPGNRELTRIRSREQMAKLSPEERKKVKDRWLAKPGNREKQYAAEKERRKLPHVRKQRAIAARKRYHQNLEVSRKKARDAARRKYRNRWLKGLPPIRKSKSAVVRRWHFLISEEHCVNGVPALQHAMTKYLQCVGINDRELVEALGKTTPLQLLKISRDLVFGRFFVPDRLELRRQWLRKHEPELVELAKRVMAVAVLRKALRVSGGSSRELRGRTPTLHRLPSRIAELEKLLTLLKP